MAEIHGPIILKNDFTENWTSNQEKVLQKAEAAIEFLQDGKIKMKVGDGQTSWKNLNYLNPDEIYIGETEPEDPDIKMWIDLNGESGGSSAPSIDLSEYYKLGVGEAIPAGADLNDYYVPGTYTFLGTDSSSIINYPPEIAKLTFRLTVMNTGNTTLLQIFVCTDALFIRYNNRYDDTNHYGSWRQIAFEDDVASSIDLSEYYKLGVGEVIPTGADLNNYVTPGTYRSSNADVTATLLNAPFDNTGFRLVVQENQDIGWITQLAFSGFQFKLRDISTSTPWYGEWQQLVASDETAVSAANARTGPLQMGKVLWTGTWTTGSIVAPGLSGYSLIEVQISGNDTAIVAAKKAASFRGIGGTAWSDATGSRYVFSATFSGDTLTWVECCGGPMTTNTLTEQIVTGIIGLL